MATLLKKTANFVVGVSIIKLLTADLKAEILHDGANLRYKTNELVRKSPYRAAGIAAAAGALTGIALTQRRPHRIHLTRF
ncbi:MAG: hypothetical protein ABI145_12310 [Steroidobacteraceae bacterium]